MRTAIAVILSVVSPGAGHAFLGDLRRAGRWLVVAASLAVAPYALARVRPSVALLAALLMIALGLRTFCGWQSWRDARVRADLRRSFRWPRAILVGLGALVLLVAWGGIVDTIGGQRRVRAARASSEAMEPTLVDGDYFLLWPVPMRLLRVDIPVVYVRGASEYIHRIVGMPLDTLSMEHGHLLRNGTRITEPYARRATDSSAVPELTWMLEDRAGGSADSLPAPTPSTWGPVIVPRNAVFVLGDNRDWSLDSRWVGFVPIDAVRAIPLLVYFSRAADSARIRWHRLGIRLLPSA